MKTVMKWLASIIAIAALVGAVLFWFARLKPRPEPITPKLPDKGQTLADIESGLDKLKVAARMVTPDIADWKLARTLGKYLVNERAFLDESDKRILDLGPPQTVEDLTHFKAVRDIGRAWQERHSDKSIAESLVMDAATVPEFNLIQSDLASAMGENRVDRLHHQARAVIDSTTKSFEWPFSGVVGSYPAGQIGRSLSSYAEGLFSEEVDSWLPLLTHNECAALVIRQKIAQLPAVWQELCPKNSFASLYLEDEKIDLCSGVSPEMLAKIQIRIDAERNELKAKVDDPQSDLTPQFQSVEGKAEAKRQIDRVYDAASCFVEAFATEAEAADDKGASICYSSSLQAMLPRQRAENACAR